MASNHTYRGTAFRSIECGGVLISRATLGIRASPIDKAREERTTFNITGKAPTMGLFVHTWFRITGVRIDSSFTFGARCRLMSGFAG